MADNMSCWHWGRGGVCCRLKVLHGKGTLLPSMSSEVPSLASVSSVFASCLSQCPVHPPQSDGEGSLNSNNPARRQSIFYFIKGAAALLLGCNDPTDLPPYRLGFFGFRRCHKREHMSCAGNVYELLIPQSLEEVCLCVRVCVHVCARAHAHTPGFILNTG